MNELYSQYALPVGSMVQEYRIIEILGIGNFGIVYRAENKYFSEIVALKEFLPADLAVRQEGENRVLPLSSDTEGAFQWALKKFLQEAKTLRELGSPDQHPNIVRVRQFIEANETAYMVMDFEKGRSLDEILKERQTLNEKELTDVLDALLDGLTRVHGASVWHRDIKPSNILIRSDGSPVLIDFGAARKDISGSDRSTMSVFSPAYAAPEQIYPIGDQGPWTDIYALGATLYRAVTGDAPTNAAKRLQGDAYVPVAEAARGNYSSAFLAAIDAALGLSPKDRPQSISDWKELLAQKTAEEDDKTIFRPAVEKPVKKTKGGEYRKLVAGLIAVVVVVAGLLVYWTVHKPVATEPTDTLATVQTDVTDKQQINGEQASGQTSEKTSDIEASTTETAPSPDMTDEQLDEPEQEASVSTVDKQTPIEKKAPLVQAQLTINSTPAGAQVFIDDTLKGKTPLNTTVADGMHALRLSLEGHYDWRSSLLIEGEGEIPLRIPMLKK